MPKLEEDYRALFMHGVCGVLHLRSSRPYRCRRLVPTVRLLGNCGPLGDEQTRRTALGVVLSHHMVREASGTGLERSWGQDDPVRQIHVMQTEGLKEDAVHFLLLTIAGIRILLR